MERTKPISRAVLVDLDGPLTRLFPDPRHLEVARALEERLTEYTGLTRPRVLDHVQVLRTVAEQAPEILTYLEARATAVEVDAARGAVPAAGAQRFLAEVRGRGYAVAVVSNNAETAVRVALDHCGLAALVDHVAGRRRGSVAALKPDPALLEEAMDALGARPQSCTFYGDTVSDMVAAGRARVRAVGVTTSPARARDLMAAGAAQVVVDLAAALDLLEPRALETREVP